MDGGVLATVVGSILGFLASLLPDAIGLLKQRLYPQATPPIVSLQYPYAGQITDGEYEVEPAVEVVVPADESANLPLAYVALDFLRSSVRPVLTYSFFAAFVFIKIKLLYHGLYVDGSTVIELMPIIWDEGTEAIFAAILAFWFGSRAISKYRK